MASKTLNIFIDLYTSMNEGKITYEEFLNSTDPRNPEGLYKEIIEKMDEAIASKEFANIDNASRIKILNVRTNILTKGDDPEMIGIKDNFGIDPAALATHRLLLLQGLKPVLDLTEKESKADIEHENKEDIIGIPYTFVSDQELAGKNSNEYFSFRVYNERGIPSEFTAKGTKQVDLTDPEAQKYTYHIFQYGNILIDKNDPEALAVEGLNGNGSGADINKGVIDLYPQVLKSVVEDTQKAIGGLRDEYGKSIIASGRGWEKEDEKQFDQWAYENLRSGKTMKDLENMTFDSPELKLNRERIKKMLQAPGMDGTSAPIINSPIPPQDLLQSIPPQGAIVPMKAPSEPLPTGLIKMKEIPLTAKEFVNMGSDYFIFIIILGFVFISAVILLNSKYICNKISRRR